MWKIFFLMMKKWSKICMWKDLILISMGLRTINTVISRSDWALLIKVDREKEFTDKGNRDHTLCIRWRRFCQDGWIFVNGKTRKLHPRECARIMGYPDTYKISDSKSQAYKQFGNSVVIDVLQLIGEEIGAVLERSGLERSESCQKK